MVLENTQLQDGSSNSTLHSAASHRPIFDYFLVTAVYWLLIHHKYCKTFQKKSLYSLFITTALMPVFTCGSQGVKLHWQTTHRSIYHFKGQSRCPQAFHITLQATLRLQPSPNISVRYQFMLKLYFTETKIQ